MEFEYAVSEEQLVRRIGDTSLWTRGTGPMAKVTEEMCKMSPTSRRIILDLFCEVCSLPRDTPRPSPCNHCVAAAATKRKEKERQLRLKLRREDAKAAAKEAEKVSVLPTPNMESSLCDQAPAFG